MNKNALAIGVIFFLVVSSIPPIVFGYNVRTVNEETLAEDYSFNRYFYPEYYDCYNVDEIPDFIEQPNSDKSIDYSSNNSVLSNQKEIAQPLDGPMDSAWPMYCHDTHHTGRSPYSTSGNYGFEKWWFKANNSVEGSTAIDKNNILYFGSWSGLYAVDLINCSILWFYYIKGDIVSSPAIDENGVIYFGTAYNAIEGDHLYALYPNGTLKWEYFVGDSIFSSPAIGNDGTVYFGSESDYIYALYSNGTLKWKYLTSVAVYSSPAIGNDGTVYCGSHDTYLYALYPNNGTLKWRYKTGHWIRTAPCISDDGTIYVVSLDNYLHAINPDGSNKWMTNVGAGTSPTIGQDGTIYAGYETLYAVNPINGSVKWTFDVGGTVRGGTPCNSVDGTIYVGTSDDSKIIAINPDGSLKWQKNIGGTCEFAPIIGEDGTIYIGSSHDQKVGDGYVSIGYLHAFNDLDSNAPSAPQIKGKTRIIPKISYKYTFKSTSPLGNDLYYWINWGDRALEEWIGPYTSGEEITVSHRYDYRGTYIIRARVKDSDNLWGPWSEYKINMPKNKVNNFNSLFFKLLEKFPILHKLLQLLK